MEITWMGQAGLLFQHDGVNVMIDPYLSDSVKKIEPQNYRRKPVDERFFGIKPDVLVITHCHLDHLDPETLDVFFGKYDGITVLAPEGCWQTLRKTYGGNNNFVLFNAGTRWTFGNLVFKAVKAEHSEPNAIGVVISADGVKYYATGDTLCNDEVIASAKREQPDVVFLPVNGVGNNMNMVDAAEFCKALGSVKAVPIHTGLFDNLKADAFPYENKVVPSFYQKIEL